MLIVLIAGCAQNTDFNKALSGDVKQQPVQELVQDIETNATMDKDLQIEGSRDSKLESQSKRLHEYGIDCSHENEYGTRRSLAIDPQNSNILYIGIEGRGVYKTTDKGTSWEKIINGLVAYPDMSNKNELCFPDIAYIYIDPANTKRVLMVTSDITTAYVDWPYGETGGIWESLDGGESWKQMIKGKINVAGSGYLAVDPKNSRIMYYPVNPDLPTFKEAPIKESLNKISSVYKTVDGGITWEELNMPMLPALQAILISIDPKDSNHVVLFTQSHDHIYGENSITEIFLHKQYPIMESFDAGKTWTVSGDNLPDPYRAVFEGDVSGNNFGHMIVRLFLFGPEFPPETTKQKSFYSVDGGKTFEETSMFIWIARYNPHDMTANNMLGYSPWQGWVAESKDAGKTWQSIGIPPEVQSYKVKVENFVWDPKDSSAVYMSGTYGNIWQSIDGGKTWKNILNLDKLPK